MGEIELGAAAEATVLAYKELANDSGKRLALAKDTTCVQFLAYVVAEGTGSLLQASIDTLELLAENKDCRPSLANTFGVMEALQELSEDARYCEELRNQAAGLFTSLQYSRYAKSEKPKIEEASNLEICSSQESLVSEKSEGNWKNRKPSRKVDSKTSGPLNTKAKTITLSIQGMKTTEDRKLVEEQMIRVRGLISMVFDLSSSRVTCRLKKDLSVTKLSAAVEKTEKFNALQVITNGNREEVVAIGQADKAPVASTSDDMPDYLPEDETPMKDLNSAMAPTGTLREAATSFISAAATLLNKSFYW